MHDSVVGNTCIHVLGHVSFLELHDVSKPSEERVICTRCCWAAPDSVSVLGMLACKSMVEGTDVHVLDCVLFLRLRNFSEYMDGCAMN